MTFAGSALAKPTDNCDAVVLDVFGNRVKTNEISEFDNAPVLPK